MSAAHSSEPWWVVLDLWPKAGASDVVAAHRRLIATAHPDRGGSDAAAARLNAARDAGLEARR